MNLANILTILRLGSPFLFILICLLIDSKFSENLYIFILLQISFTGYTCAPPAGRSGSLV